MAEVRGPRFAANWGEKDITMIKEIADAGSWALKDIARQLGRLPITVTECEEVTAAYAIRTVAAPGTAASLLVTEREIPTIFYDPTLTPHRQKLSIIHELVEWLMIDKYPQLWDWAEPRTYNQDGGDNPTDLRHQAASFAEEVYSLWVQRFD